MKKILASEKTGGESIELQLLIIAKINFCMQCVCKAVNLHLVLFQQLFKGSMIHKISLLLENCSFSVANHTFLNKEVTNQNKESYSMNRFEQVQISQDMSGQVWTGLDRFERFRQVQISSNRSVQVLIGSDKFGQI